MPSSDARDTEIVRRAIDLVGALDIDGAVALLSDDFELELPFRNDGQPRLLPRDAAVAFLRVLPKLFARMDFFDVVVHGALPSGVIVAEYRSNGLTQRGRPYPNAYLSLFNVRDDKIARWREYFDPCVVSDAFGPTGSVA